MRSAPLFAQTLDLPTEQASARARGASGGPEGQGTEPPWEDLLRFLVALSACLFPRVGPPRQSL
eukprot:3795343-Alexandrium_andersonii.AAC.1